MKRAHEDKSVVPGATRHDDSGSAWSTVVCGRHVQIVTDDHLWRVIVYREDSDDVELITPHVFESLVAAWEWLLAWVRGFRHWDPSWGKPPTWTGVTE